MTRESEARFGHEDLSPREHEVLQMTADGHTAISIAKELWLAEETVKTYKKVIIQKLQARNSAHAVATGLRRGLIS